MANALYTALTEEEIEELRRIQMERATKEGFDNGFDKGYDQGSKATKFEDVDKLIAEGTFAAERACEILDVDYDSYLEYKERAGRK